MSRFIPLLFLCLVFGMKMLFASYPNTVRQLQLVGDWDLRRGRPLKIGGVVTYMEPAQKLVILQDAYGAVALRGSEVPSELRLGHQVVFEAPAVYPYFRALPRYPLEPSRRPKLSSFEFPVSDSEASISRIRGYLYPPRTGIYRFSISSDDTSELWLSDSEEPAHAKRIAKVDTWTRVHEWGRSPEQRSEELRLEAGHRYFIEVFHEQMGGRQHLDVAWEGPGLEEQVIAGAYLSPWEAHKDVEAGSRETSGLAWEIWDGVNVDGAWRLSTCYDFKGELNAPRGSFVDLGQSVLPAPVELDLEQVLTPETWFTRCRVEGVVGFASLEGSTLFLELVDGNRRLPCYVSGWQGRDPRELIDRTVSVTGIAEPGQSLGGLLQIAVLRCPTRHSVQLLNPALSARASMEMSILELVNTGASLTPGQPVRIIGEYLDTRSDGSIILSDTGSFTAHYSSDGSQWKQLGPAIEVPMGRVVHAGLALNSNAADAEASAVFSEVRGLGSKLEQTSIGFAERTGSLTVEQGRYMLHGRGHEIWDPPDQFHFAHEHMRGEGELSVKVEAVEAAALDAKAGLMIRESLAPDAQFVDLIMKPKLGVSLQWRRRAQGVITKSADDFNTPRPCWIKLARRYTTLRVASATPMALEPGQLVEAMGFVSSEGGVVFLEEASCRRLNDRSPDDAVALAGVRPSVEISRLNEAPELQASLDVFKIRGVVTFSGMVAGKPYLSVQDGSGGLFVVPDPGMVAHLPAEGELVEIHSNPGWTTPAPHVQANTILSFGPAVMPKAIRHPLEYLLPKRGEGTWIELEGIVRSVSKEGLMQIKENGELFSIYFGHQPTGGLEGWVDSLVRVRGVLSFPSERERLLLVPSTAHLQRVHSAPTPPFEGELSNTGRLVADRLINKSLHRILLKGRLTHLEANSLYMQDEQGAVRVDPSALPPGLLVGDQVEVFGFPEMGEERLPVLAQSLVRAVEGKVAEPLRGLEIEANELRSRKGQLVVLRGTLLERSEGNGKRQLLLVSSKGVRVPLVFHGAFADLPAPPIGSVLSVTGISLPSPGEDFAVDKAIQLGRLPAAGSLLLRSAEDLKILEKPRWWVVRRTLLVSSALIVLGLVTVFWIHRLRRRVASRTEQLEAAMARLRKETQIAATLAERNRLAGEIHDSLEQGFSGLMLQLETTAKLATCAPDVKTSLALARNMVSFNRAEVQHAVWDLQSPLLENSDLSTALKGLANQLGLDGSPVVVEVEGTRRTLPPSTEHHLLRIAQEAITNAVKHAEATRIAVVLNYAEEATSLSVQDNGCGFEPKKVLTGGLGHFGLRSLRGRASKVGGTISINSTVGEGTTVMIRIPKRPETIL